MSYLRSFLITYAALFCFSANAQQLIINEVSQGSGSGEYVEFVVIGTPTCQTPVPCIDLRGVIIDDNNGYFASGGGTGIASGAIRFADIPFWSCVPQGTYIVVYNESDVNPALPPADVNLTDGNCRLILPANSNLLEGTSVSPNTGDPTYPGAASWTAGGGTWNQVAMSNSNDSFQIPNLGINGTPLHSVSWGNNTSGSIIYFSGSASSKVFSFTNAVSNDWNLQSNWVSGTVGVNETPGAANSTANDAWIASMNPQCGIAAGLQATVQTTNTGCGAGCSGTATTQVTGGTTPYTYSWSNGSTAASLNNLCAGTYTVTVTDAGGCSFTTQGTVANEPNSLNINFSVVHESCIGSCDGSLSATITGGSQPYSYSWSNGVTTQTNTDLCPGTYNLQVSDQNGCQADASVIINPGVAAGDATILTTGPFTTSDAPVQMQSVMAGGTWLTMDCASCLTASGIFDPQVAGAGTFQICHTSGSGACMDNDCVNIVVTEGCSPQTTEEIVTFCAEDSVLVFGNWENEPDTYSQTFTDINGCDSTHNIILLWNPIFNNHDAAPLCPGDSVLVFGEWITQPGEYTQQQFTPAGCEYTFHFIVYTEACENEDFHLFVPNTFTPNGDQVNDTFKIEIIGGLVEEGYIFNRWGNQIVRFDELNIAWDGKTKAGEPVQDGVYTYLIYYTPTGGVRESVHGFVTVIR